jgi:hypothetical protein
VRSGAGKPSALTLSKLCAKQGMSQELGLYCGRVYAKLPSRCQCIEIATSSSCIDYMEC